MTPITPATRPFVVTFIQRITNHITVLALAIQINGYEKSPIYNDESLMKIWAIFYHHTIPLLLLSFLRMVGVEIL